MVMGADEAVGAGQGEAAGPVEVFVSYDPKDEPFLLELEASLAVLVKAGQIPAAARREPPE
ncbi:MAG TPA: hypothetical protein VE093_28955 [Polyangiaceae bacterium]|jgi:hypothetical protein|nr:hypothetical protein [Polyangiaceae bacterium]